MKLYVETRLFNRPVVDLCEWALGEAGQSKLNWQPIDLVALIGATITNVTPVAEERNGVLAAQIDRGTLVLLNLVANALCHRPVQGHIASKCGKLIGSRRSTSGTGEGIAPEDLPHGFVRFCRSDQSRTRHDGSCTLDLAYAGR